MDIFKPDFAKPLASIPKTNQFRADKLLIYRLAEGFKPTAL